MCYKVSGNLLTLLMVPLIVEARGIPPESHHRESIPREFVLKTISPPPPASKNLYKALLEAPFYRGRPFRAKETMDGCVDCEICEVRRNRVFPTSKWTVMRIIRGSRRPYHLQLTLLPRGDDDFYEKNTSPGSYVCMTSRNGAPNSFANDLIIENPDPDPFHGRAVKTASGGVRTTSTLNSRPEVLPDRKRGREIRGHRPHLVGGPTTPSILFHPTEGNHPRLPLGRDQLGKKRLVHVVPATGNPESSLNPETFHRAHLERSLNMNRADILTYSSPAATNELLVENEALSSSVDTMDDDRIAQDKKERIRPVAELTSVTPQSDIDLPEDHVVTANAHDDSESGSTMSIDPKDLDEAKRNSFGGLSAEGLNGSGGTLILKEVAKSVVDHPSDTLQGFNLLTKTATTSITTTTRY